MSVWDLQRRIKDDLAFIAVHIGNEGKASNVDIAKIRALIDQLRRADGKSPLYTQDAHPRAKKVR